MKDFIKMLLHARTNFRVRWCHGEDVPCWEIDIEGENNTHASFTFNVDHSLDSVFVA